MYKACIFDLDGTLTDTLESLTVSVNKTLNELGLPNITSEQCKYFVGDGARKLIERALIASGDKNLTLIEQGMEIYGRVFQKYCTYHVAPYEGVLDLLQELKKRGVRLAVLSNKPHAQTKDVVATYFEPGTFSFVQGQQEGIPRKPNPTALLWIAEKMEVSPEECIYIGDSDVDMHTGNGAGMVSVGVTWGFRTRQILKEHGAKHIIDQPKELISIMN